MKLTIGRNNQRRNPDKCSCGRFKGSPLCQCRIDQVRREMVADEQLKMCLQMGAETETREREDSE